MSFATKTQASKGNIYTARTKDASGRQVFYILQVPAAKEAAFMKAMQGTQMVDYSQYGEMLAYGYGTPDERVAHKLKTEYGYVIPS